MKIYTHCTVSKESVDYYRYLKASYKNLAKNPERIVFLAYCLDSECVEILKNDKETAEVIELPYARGSNGHAISIERAVSNFKAGEYNLLADTDTVMLLKNWDEILIKKADAYPVIGITVYEDIGGFSSGSTKYQTYKQLPTVTWMFFSPTVNVSSLRGMMPDKEHPLPIDSEELSKIYNLPQGYILTKDVGWQVPEFLYRNKIPYITIMPIKPSSKEAIVLAGAHDYHDEFHWEGKPFLVHQRGSMKHRFRIDPMSKTFYAACEKYLCFPSWSVKPTPSWKNFLNRKWYDRVLRRLG